MSKIVKKTKRFTAGVLCLVMVGWSACATAQVTVVDSGYCGGGGDSTNLTWTLTSDGVLTISGSGEMENNYKFPWNFYHQNIKIVIIGDSVTSIGDGVFFSRLGLTSVTIGNSVTSIGYKAFCDCLDLTSVTIGNSVTSIGNYAFYFCYSLTFVTIGNSITSIGNYAFSRCSSLTSVTIPDNVTNIGDYAFYDCSSLTSVTIGDSVTSIGDYAFYECRSLTSVTIPNSVISIGDGTFQHCSSLTTITIPDNVTNIGDYAFAYCSDLTSVTIPNSVTSIGSSAFYYCSSLTSVTIGNSVTSIRDRAFEKCRNLNFITSNAIVPPINGNYVFIAVPQTIPVYVPCGSIPAYKASAVWEFFTNYHTLSSDTTFISDTCSAETYNGNGFSIPAVLGVYYRTETSVNDCDSVICLTLTVTGVGIAETNDIRPEIRVYPNPASNQLTIDNGQLTVDNVEIYSVVGQCVMQLSCRDVINHISTIDISHLENGIYFLKINNQVVKFIKK